MSMARRMRSGTGVGPGICRKWRPARRGAFDMRFSPIALRRPSLKQARGALPTHRRRPPQLAYLSASAVRQAAIGQVSAFWRCQTEGFSAATARPAAVKSARAAGSPRRALLATGDSDLDRGAQARIAWPRAPPRPLRRGAGAKAAARPPIALVSRGEEGHYRAMPVTSTVPTSHRLAARLARDLEGEVLFDRFSRGRYATDASHYQIEPVGVIVPKTDDDVRLAMAAAREEGVPLLPRGGGTSQSGQTVGRALVMDFSKYLKRLISVDPGARSCVVEPGI